MTVDILFLLGGVVCAGIGGELFLRGVLGLSAWARIPKAVTAATLAALATSSPEISVGITAGLDGKTPIALGDALGSNIVNVALILGLVLILGPISFEWRANRREYLTALLVPVVIFLLLLDNSLQRWEGVICLGLFMTWLAVVVREAIRQRSTSELTITPREGVYAIGFALVGMGFLFVAGQVIIRGAFGLGTRLGIDPFIVGVTLVALGTSAPELATAVLSKLRGHDEVGVGTILGSNIFNCLFIVGMAITIGPCEEQLSNVWPSLCMGILVLMVLFPYPHQNLGRLRGSILLLLYVASVVMAWWLQPPTVAYQ